jgi:ubiquinone biosynthesis protein
LFSSRPDLIPPDWAEALQTLQDKVAPFPTPEACKIIEQELGRPVSELFSEFDLTPLGSGSIAQIYRATTRDNQRVVVKVRRPGIEQIIKLDMYVLRRLAESIEKYVPELSEHRPTEMVAEIAPTLYREMDLLNEATVTERVHRFFADDPNVVVPGVRWDLTSNKVLTLTYVTGMHFHAALADPTLNLDRPKLARILTDALIRQYLDLGIFHADPHPGNLLIIPPDRIAIVDFGMSGRIDRHRSIELIMLLTACNYRQMDLVVDILSEMGSLTEATNSELLKRDLAVLLDRLRALPLRHLRLQDVFRDITTLARAHGVNLPQDFVMVGKSLVNVGGAAMMLDPDQNPNEVIRPRVRQAFFDVFGKEGITREMVTTLWHTGLLVKDLPRQLREFSRKALRGQIKVHVQQEGMEHLIRELDRSSNRMSFAMIIAAIIIGSSLIFHAKLGPMVYHLPLLGLTGYLFAGIMGLWLVIAIIRSGKLS